jgi:hypothetical protein
MPAGEKLADCAGRWRVTLVRAEPGYDGERDSLEEMVIAGPGWAFVYAVERRTVILRE